MISPVLRSRLAVLAALPVPAQLTRMRSWPLAARALAKAASTSSSLVTLHGQKTPPPISWQQRLGLGLLTFRSKMAILTPCAASARAVASPRPEAPPVTTAVMEESSSWT